MSRKEGKEWNRGGNRGREQGEKGEQERREVWNRGRRVNRKEGKCGTEGEG